MALPGQLRPNVKLIGDDTDWPLNPLELTAFALYHGSGLSISEIATQLFEDGYDHSNRAYVARMSTVGITRSVRTQPPDPKQKRLVVIWLAVKTPRIEHRNQAVETRRNWNRLLSLPPLVTASHIREVADLQLAIKAGKKGRLVTVQQAFPEVPKPSNGKSLPVERPPANAPACGHCGTGKVFAHYGNDHKYYWSCMICGWSAEIVRRAVFRDLPGHREGSHSRQWVRR